MIHVIQCNLLSLFAHLELFIFGVLIFQQLSLLQIKNDIEAEVLCMTAIGNIKLQQSNMEETKVSIYLFLLFIHSFF